MQLNSQVKKVNYFIANAKKVSKLINNTKTFSEGCGVNKFDLFSNYIMLNYII